MLTASAPGPWLRLTALAASGATLLAVVSGAAGARHGAPAARRARAAAARRARSSPPGSRTGGCSPRPRRHGTLRRRGARHRPRRASRARGARVRRHARRHRARPPARGACRSGASRDYVTLTKPRIMTLLLLTGFCGMVAGAHGLPPWDVAVAAMVGLAMACGGASAINHVLDRDIDRLMGERTRSRPVAADRVPPTYALEFGLALSAFSFALLASTVNVLTATLALVGNLFYVVVYTRWLKRSTPQNIVIGGAAGAVPPLVGWAAATGSLAWPALGALPDRLPLDAAALLGARAPDQARLRGREDPDAAGRPRRPRDDEADRPLLARPRRLHDRALRARLVQRRLPRRRARARRRLPGHGRARCAAS